MDKESVGQYGVFPGFSLVLLALGVLAMATVQACDGAARQATPAQPSDLPQPTPATSGRRIVGYFISWGIYARKYQVDDIPADKLTHVNFAFANVNGKTGECALGDNSDDASFRYLRELRKQHPHLQTLISVGGWTWSGNFSDVALTEESRRRFVTSCLNKFLLGRYEGTFDGIDIDWEYPVSGGKAGNTERPEDKRNFTLLLQEFRRQLDDLGAKAGRHYLLTIAAPAGAKIYGNIELREVSQYLDWMNLMAYDFHGGWEKTTNFLAPLYAPAADPAGADANLDAAVQAYLAAGVPPDKLVVGVPFYGRGWAGVPDVDHGLYQQSTYLPRGTWETGAFDYKDLVQNYGPEQGYTRYWDDEAKVPWLYNPAKQVMITYDDPQSVALKADYVRSHGLGGIMFWELTADGGTLLEVIYTALSP